MADDEKFDLHDAYGVETPDDNRELYAKWAASYDTEFLAAHEYVYHRGVVEAFTQRHRTRPGPIADVGCGTGVVGLALRASGYAPIDGLDISPEMLEVAATKSTGDGGPVYRALHEVDLTEPLKLKQHSYSGLVSVGTFTHGHLGPEPIAALVDLIEAGGSAAIGINGEHYASRGFEQAMADLVAAGRIADVDLVSVPVYNRPPADYAADDPNLRSTVVVFTVT